MRSRHIPPLTIRFPLAYKATLGMIMGMLLVFVYMSLVDLGPNWLSGFFTVFMIVPALLLWYGSTEIDMDDDGIGFRRWRVAERRLGWHEITSVGYNGFGETVLRNEEGTAIPIPQTLDRSHEIIDRLARKRPDLFRPEDKEQAFRRTLTYKILLGLLIGIFGIAVGQIRTWDYGELLFLILPLSFVALFLTDVSWLIIEPGQLRFHAPFGELVIPRSRVKKVSVHSVEARYGMHIKVIRIALHNRRSLVLFGYVKGEAVVYAGLQRWMKAKREPAEDEAANT